MVLETTKLWYEPPTPEAERATWQREMDEYSRSRSDQQRDSEALLEYLKAVLALTGEVQLHEVAGEGRTTGVLPNEVMLGFLGERRLRVRKPIRVRFSEQDDQCVAEAPDFNEFGYGTSRSAAIGDLQHALAELYLSLRDDQERLGRNLERVWKRLQKTLEWHEHQSQTV